MTQEDNQAIQNNESTLTSLQKFIVSVLTFKQEKTQTGELVFYHIFQRIIPTIQLSLFAIIFGSILGIYGGLFCTFLNIKIITQMSLGFCGFVLSTPIFIVAIFLLILFFWKLNLLPPGGYVAGNILYLILPGIALGSRTLARIFIYTYSESKKETYSDYILFLKSRGFKYSTIVFKHVLLKILPILMVFILIDFSSLLSGAIIVEEIFFFPGVGKSLYSSIKSMDEALLRILLVYMGIVFYIFTRLAKKFQSIFTGD
ncbi:MAG: ABC transporter permease [Leptospiraceae bacterium]|nr:ABC transporter permease [Leptospiraceae bacterium]